MYRSFKVSNFRCLAELSLTGLERFNLIAGVNNVGKTALLEAMFLHCGAYNPELILKVNAFRGVERIKLEFGRGLETPWDSLFNNHNISRAIELEGENKGTVNRSLRLKMVRRPDELAKVGQFILHGQDKPESGAISSEAVQVLELEYKAGKQSGKYHMILGPKGLQTEPIPPPPPFPGFFLTARGRIPLAEDAERFGKLEISGQQNVLLKALKVVEPRLLRLAVVVTGGAPMMHGDIQMDRLLPLSFMGEGMVRLASLVLAIGNAQKGVVLVDEIENGFHHSILPKVWQVVAEAARQFDTQVFATTHSLECIVAAHRSFAESENYDFSLHRLEQRKETIHAITYDQETLAAAIETGLEVR
jgi:hypothetical protein